MNLRDLASFYRLRKKLSENPKSIVTDEDNELINDVPLINDVAVETQGTNPDLWLIRGCVYTSELMFIYLCTLRIVTNTYIGVLR